MKSILLAVFLFLSYCGPLSAQANLPFTPMKSPSEEEKSIMSLSASKWNWMADKKVDSLAGLFDEHCVFVHMGGSWGKTQELETIQKGNIWYKKAEVYGASVNLFGNTAIVLNDIDLLAVVGGNEVVHAFMVTEVYVKANGQWHMGSLTFSTLIRPVKMKDANGQPMQAPKH